MRSFLAKCWVVLLALALVGGNVHARLPAVAAGPAAPDLSSHAGGSDHSRHHDRTDKADKAGQCCCHCSAGCVSGLATAAGPNGIGRASYGASIRYGASAVSLHGRVILPDPEPPRPSAPI